MYNKKNIARDLVKYSLLDPLNNHQSPRLFNNNNLKLSVYCANQRISLHEIINKLSDKDKNDIYNYFDYYKEDPVLLNEIRNFKVTDIEICKFQSFK